MRVMIDIVHPAHVHFFHFLHDRLVEEGHEVLVVARDKEVSLELLEDFGISYRTVSRAAGQSGLARASELVRRDWALVQLGRRFRPHVVLTRNPSGVHAARLLRVPAIFDTDDGRAAGLHFKLAAPLATVVTTPESMPESYGRNHVRYPGYKALAYLHPDHFRPDPEVPRQVAPQGEPIFVLRFVANDAVHDSGVVGIAPSDRRALIAVLREHGRVVISSEAELSDELEPYRFSLRPSRLHDLLAAASLYIGDSGTMAAEAALLGVPSMRLSSWEGPMTYLAELRDRYGLVATYGATEFPLLLDRARRIAVDPTAERERSRRGREKMLREKVDVTAWYYRLVCDVVANHRGADS